MSNDQMARFLRWWAEMILDPKAQTFENVSVCLTVMGRPLVMVVSSDDQGHFDENHEAVHHFLHHTDWTENGPYTLLLTRNAPMVLARTFNKINMGELGKIILHDIEQAISRDDSFRLNLTAHEASFDFKLTLDIVPSPGEPHQTSTTVVAGGRTLVEQRGNEIVSLVNPEAPRERIEITLKRRHSAAEEPPDLLRKQTGLYIPNPQLDPATGTIVDIPREVVTREQMEQQGLTDTRRQAIRERDLLMIGKAPLRFEARPAQELAQDVTEEGQRAEMRPDIVRADRVETVLPPEHVVVEE